MHLSECPDGPWVKALAVMPAIRRLDVDIIVMADADVWCDGLQKAVSAVTLGAPWAVPHLNVNRLSERGTQAVLGGAEWRSQPLEQRPYPGVVGGGYVVARRDVLLETPLDPRFVGWGQEDSAHGLALTALHGPPWRGDAELVHLWHPPQQRLSRVRGNRDGWKLHRRYREALFNPTAMRRLIDEAHVALNTSEPAVHDPKADPVGYR